jgi:DNA-binding LacI/PurR family transcriptional regulator
MAIQTIKRVTQEDIAKELGVARSTVQRALADCSRISSQTRKRVQMLSRNHGYRPNVMAQGLRHSRTNTIGVILGRYMPEHMIMFGAIEGEADRRNFSAMLAISDMDLDSERSKVHHLIDRGADALIVNSVTPLWEFYAELVANGTPVVYFHSDKTSVISPVISPDHEYSAYIITKYLTSLGHRRIGYIDAPFSKSFESRPIRGYKDALAEASIDFDERLFFAVKSKTRAVPGEHHIHIYENGCISGEYMLGLVPRPTAVIAPSGIIASGLMRAAMKTGLKIPEELSIVAVDIGLLGGMLPIPITGVASPYREMGKLLASKAIDMLEKTDHLQDVSVLLKGELIVGESTCPVPD